MVRDPATETEKKPGEKSGSAATIGLCASAWEDLAG